MLEDVLNYWREDFALSEHHFRWHETYPYGGKPVRRKKLLEKGLLLDRELTRNEIIANPSSTVNTFMEWNDRHGELFAYMHRQLLARYYAERLSVDLPEVQPLDDYRRHPLEGYDTQSLGTFLTRDGNLQTISARLDGTMLHDNDPLSLDSTMAEFGRRPGAKIVSQEMFRDRILLAIRSGEIDSINHLSELIEPTDRNNSNYYGALHNDGHLLISLDADNPSHIGPMFWEMTAVRDPVFYRWHKHIDDMFAAFEETLPSYEFDDLPNVEALSIDLFSTESGQNSVSTFFRRKSTQQADGTPLELWFIDHEDFEYEITVKSEQSGTTNIAARIFLVPTHQMDERRSWIEMDKFTYNVPPHSKTKIVRKSEESSIVRHPVVKGSFLEANDHPIQNPQTADCRCGWPYTMLLPRGTTEGMKFSLMVILTSGDEIDIQAGATAESISFCGAKDGSYPDEREMGYPFNRDFIEPISERLTGSRAPKQTALSDIEIFHKGRLA